MTDPILRDLSIHLADRMDKCINDYFDRLKWSGKEYSREQLADHLAQVVLGVAAAAMKCKTQSTLDDFVKLAAQIYSNVNTRSN